MKLSHQIANRLREVILNGTWIANTNYKKELEHLDWQTATAKHGSLNTIAILAQHIHYYIAGLVHAFETGRLEIKDSLSFSFPAIESQQDWETFLNRFFSDTEHFAALVEQMPDIRLEEVFMNEKYGSYRRNIDAMIEHSYYHLGQIVLLKKL